MEEKGATKTQHKEAIMMRGYVKEKVLARGKKVSLQFRQWGKSARVE